MKRSKLSVALLAIGIAASALVFNACKSDGDDEPTPGGGGEIPPGKEITFSGDTIVGFPAPIFPTFFPSGYYNPAADVKFGVDSCDETPAYQNECLRVVYKYNNDYFGAGFLNQNSWDAIFHVKSTVKKITFKIRTDYSANVSINAFQDADKYGGVKLEQKATPVTPVWETKTITLLAPYNNVERPTDPSGFAAPLSIIIDYTDGAKPAIGKVVVVDIKDIQFEE